MSYTEIHGGIRNLSNSPDIAFQYQEDGQPWPSILAAHNGTPQDYRAIGKSRFVDDGSGLKEYWYKENTELDGLVPRFANLETPQDFLEAIQNESAAAEQSKQGAELIKEQMQEMLTEGTVYEGFWDPLDNIPNVSTVLPAGSYYIIGRTASRNLGAGLVLYEEGRKLISNGTSYDQSPPIKPGLNTVSAETLVGWLQSLFQQLPDNSPFVELKVDSENRILWAIRKDGVIVGKFEIKEDSMTPNSVNADAIQEGSIDYTKLALAVKSLIYESFDNTFSDYLKLDVSNNNYIITAVKKDGTFKIGKPELPANSIVEAWLASAVRTKLNNPVVGDGAVSESKLATDVKNLIQTYFVNTNSQYLDLKVDELFRIIHGTKKTGEFFIQRPEFPDRSIKENWLSQATINKLISPSFNRLNAANVNDVSYVSDGLIRAVEIPVFQKTDSVGSRFREFISVETPYLKGLNDTGADIQIVNSGNLVIRGKSFRGTFDPNAAGVSSGTAGTIGLVDKGVYGHFAANSYPALPAGSTGDFWTMDAGSVAITRQGLTFKHGDLLVKTASGYAIQAAPGDGNFFSDDYWNISVDGVFGGVQYLVNDRIYFNGAQTAGGPRYARFIRSKAGEYYYMGSCNSSAFAPVSPKNGDIYDVTFSGTITASSLVVNIGDFVIYLGGWGVFEGKMKTILSGQSFHMPCRSAADYMIRRADKSNTVVTLKAYGQRGSIIQRATDDIHAISDSMLGVNGTATKLALATGRSVTLNTYGGSTFDEELRMLKYNILTQGDLNKGKTVIVMGGQNDGSDTTAMKRAAFLVESLLGSRQKRVLFMSFTGTQICTWNGVRMVVDNAESAYGTNSLNGTNFIADLEQFYRAAFPQQFFNTRQAMLDAAVGRTTIDLRFPGMTEAAVAATYHIPPKSFFNESAGKPTKSTCNYLGIWAAVGLPTGGNDLDYYLRTANGTVGNEIIKIAGVWTEFADDATHWSDLGAQTIANALSAVLTSKNI
ncbi:MAG: hypothetical protein ABIN80_02875 [Dyadobacter sp.]|uniref:hypothetical protein n=1 Tax=Dyadobacter sp. TaxID=1914288 RepID=UPI003264C7C8